MPERAAIYSRGWCAQTRGAKIEQAEEKFLCLNKGRHFSGATTLQSTNLRRAALSVITAPFHPPTRSTLILLQFQFIPAETLLEFLMIQGERIYNVFSRMGLFYFSEAVIRLL